MSELRQDRTSGHWVIVAPERSRRPQDWQDSSHAEPATGYAADCPFCPGNESKLAGIAEEVASEAAPGWRLRVVPNAYPLVSPAGPAEHRITGPHAALPARGCHEVIIESPRHDADLVHRSDAEIATIVEAYHRRHLAMLRQPGMRAVIVFRNRGLRAGASLRHPHSQIVGVGVVPPKLRAMARWGRDRYRASGCCATCQEIALERRESVRVLEESGGFMVLVPFAASAPYEQWLVPRRHAASFAATDAPQRAELAALLGRSLRRLVSLLGPVAYNWVIDSAATRDADTAYLHWRLRIVPDLTTPAGFELGSGFVVNPSLPEADASALRRVVPA